MAIDLRKIPAEHPLPGIPKWWFWLLLLGIVIGVATSYQIFINQDNKAIDTKLFWDDALFIPVAIWAAALVCRLVFYYESTFSVNSWNAKRERTLQYEISQGRRYLNILATSVHTALRLPEDKNGKMQWQAIEKKQQALKSQTTWLNDQVVRHSQLNASCDQPPQDVLNQAMINTVNELSKALAPLPADLPLYLLLENQSSLLDVDLQEMWVASIFQENIQQKIKWIHTSGLNAVDQWLDTHHHESALFLVLASNFSPSNPQGTAESVIGLLMSNPCLSDSPKPLAQLHRPEKAYGNNNDDMEYAMQQALLWGNSSVADVKNGWLVGVNENFQQNIATAIKNLSLPLNIGEDLHNIDTTLGYPGIAACWLTIACASVINNGNPQLIISGTTEEHEPLWATIITPAKSP